MIITEQRGSPFGRQRRSRTAQFAALLEEFYEDLLEQGVPERLAALVRRLPDGDAPVDQDQRRLALVVESDDEARALAATLLEETELAVVECTSAEAALSILQRKGERVAFIFADEDLAGPRGGQDLARSATGLWPHVHVVITTSGDDSLTLDDMPGTVRALRKPWRGLDVLVAAERAVYGQGSA